MSPEMLAQQAADAELEARALPDLMAEYADDKMDFIGFTGTPEELLKFCPVPHDQMTLEAKNTFLINIMNASGASIKEEHVPYATELLEASGQEFNLQIRPVEPVQESESARKEPGVIFGESVPTKSGPKPEVGIPTAIIAKHEVIPEVEATEVVSDTALMTAEQMNNWLQEVRAEYEQEDIQTSVSSEAGSTTEKRKSPKLTPLILREAASPNETLEEFMPAVVDTQAEPNVPAALSEVVATQAVENMKISLEETSVASTDGAEAAEAFSSVEELNVPAPPVIESGDGTLITPMEKSLPAIDALDPSELITEETYDDSAVAGSEVVFSKEVFEQKVIEVKDILDALMSTDRIMGIEESGSSEAQPEVEVVQDDEFVQNFAASIQALPEKPHASADEQPKIIFDAVISTSLKIQEMQQVGELSPEVVEELKEELETLCKRLLESLGVEADEDSIARFMERVLASNLSNIPHKKLTPQELAKLGTHEYKLEGWFHKFKQLLDSALHPHQVVGRVALNLTNVTF